MVGDWEERTTSRGGLRRDFRDTAKLGSWPEESFCRLAKGLGILGRMY